MQHFRLKGPLPTAYSSEIIPYSHWSIIRTGQ